MSVGFFILALLMAVSIGVLIALSEHGSGAGIVSLSGADKSIFNAFPDDGVYSTIGGSSMTTSIADFLRDEPTPGIKNASPITDYQMYLNETPKGVINSPVTMSPNGVMVIRNA